jgi:iron complex outermembrane receptor protein
MRLDYGYKSLTHMDFSNAPSVAQGGYGLLNARISFATRDDRWQVALSGQNLTDKLYFDNGVGSYLGAFGFTYVFYGPPRTITASVRYRFAQ